MPIKVAEKYSFGSKLLHWLIAIMVITMLSGSFFLDDLPGELKGTAFMLHKSFGLTILFLMLMRIFWISHKGRPELPSTVSSWEVVLSRVVQGLFYILLIIMPLCGWIMSVAANRIPVYFGLFPVPFAGIPHNEFLAGLMNRAHITIAWVLVSLVFLHVAGALKHHFINKDNVLKRMLRAK